MDTTQKQQVNLRLPRDLAQWLRVVSAERNVRQNVVVAELLEQARKSGPGPSNRRAG